MQHRSLSTYHVLVEELDRGGALECVGNRAELLHLYLETYPFLSAFPMFVPSLSWSNDRFHSQMALQKKWRFSRLLQGLQHHDLLLRRDDLRIHLRQTAFILSH
eukprot:COSAG06_NODE_12186_length_1411_cov_11.514482_2_plen_104_part_00